MNRKIGLFFNRDKEPARKAFPEILRWLKKRGVDVMSNFEKGLNQTEFALVLGGDGTILRLARSLAPFGIPILGVNLGRLGFLAETDFSDLYRTLEKALQYKLKIEERLMLEITLELKKGKKSKKSLVLNDCYLHTGPSTRILEIETFLNGEFLATYTGDGLIVSTPTGSTAYSLAASGPIVSPHLPVLILTPICPHTLAQRPLLVSESDRLQLTLKDGNSGGYAFLSLDGQESIRIDEKSSIFIESAPQKLKLLVHPQRSYYDILRKKLRWGER